MAAAQEADIDDAVAAATDARGQGWGSRRPKDRGRILWRIGELIRERAEFLAQLDCADAGRLLRHAMAADVVRAAEMFEFYAGLADKIRGSTYQSDFESLAYSLREPYGVVAAIIPWNSPLVSAAGKIAPALACGNTVVLKPAEQAPLSSLELAAISVEAGLPPGTLNVVPGFGAAAGAALVRHPGVDKVAFTGGTSTGRQILKDASETIKSVTLELGGKAPHIVFADGDPSAAMASALFSTFNHAGQICTAGTRLFVESSIAEEFVENLSDRAAALHVGNPAAPDTEVGPMITPQQVERVEQFVESAVQGGARLRTGGRKPEGPAFESGNFYEPTIFDRVEPMSQLAREEIFGPVLTVFEFDNLNDLVRDANDVPYGLSASVWTSDIHKATELAARLDAGTVWINSAHKMDPAVPFGGFKQSGLGLEYGMEAITTYTRLKTVWTTTKPQQLTW